MCALAILHEARIPQDAGAFVGTDTVCFCYDVGVDRFSTVGYYGVQ